MNSVDRSQKGNRLTPNGVGNDRNVTIAVVEVVGLRDAAIVYRDRNGRVLFRSDPITNSVVVAKDVVLPEITIRDAKDTAVKPLPIEVLRTQKPKLPVGCDPSFSAVAEPSHPSLIGRCLTENARAQKIATLLQ